LRFSIRRLEDADAETVVALYARAASVEPGLGPVPLADWQRFTQLPQNNGCQDFRVAECGGQLIGLAESSLRDQGHQKVRFFKLVVDPAARRQGIATALLDNLLAIENSPETLSLQTLVSSQWPSGIAFVSAFGFTHLESEITMRCECLVQPAPRAGTKGVSFEKASDNARYADEIARIHNAAYASDVSFRQVSPEEMKRDLDGELLWIVLDSENVIGFCRLQPEADMVWLESIAIDPANHNRGFGSELAYRALLSSSVRADHSAALNVSSKNAAAMSVYRRLGFVPRHEKRRFSASRGLVLTSLARRSAGLTATSSI
jgi:ribosomal protein S18 acetylase RimI-like enzyme